MVQLKEAIIMFEICQRCHRKLKNQKAKEIGYGSCCYRILNPKRVIQIKGVMEYFKETTL